MLFNEKSSEAAEFPGDKILPSITKWHGESPRSNRWSVIPRETQYYRRLSNQQVLEIPENKKKNQT